MISGIRINEKKYRKTGGVISNIALCGMGGLMTKVSRGLETYLLKLTANSGEELKAVFHNRIAFSRPIYERSQNPFGRFINWISMETSNGDIEISGIEIIALLKLLRDRADIEIYESGAYLLSFVEAERMLERLNKK